MTEGRCFTAHQPVHPAFAPCVRHPGVLDLGPDRLAYVLQEVGVGRIVEDSVRSQIARVQGEQGGDGGEAHHCSPRGRQHAAGVDKTGGADEIDGKDLPPVRHGGRHAGGVRDGTERTELRDPGTEAGHPPFVPHVEDEGLDLGSVARSRQHVRLCGQQHLVPVDQQEDVDHVGHACGTRRAHTAGCSRHDPYCHAQLPIR